MAQPHLSIDNSRFGSTRDVLSNNTFNTYQVFGAHPELRPFLSPLDAESRHRTIRSKLTNGTGEWLLNSGEFKRWKTAQGPQVFCLTGEPGEGKSSLFCHVVESLRPGQNEPLGVVSFIYCDYLDVGLYTARNIIGVFLWQIITYLDADSDIVKKLQERRRHDHSLTIEENVELLCNAATHANSNPVWLCSDALDELNPLERNILLQKFAQICRSPVFRIFLTGRSNAGVEDSITRHMLGLSPSTTIAYSSISRDGKTLDIRRFLERRLTQDTAPSSMNEELRKAIFHRLAGIDSTFLLAALNIELILQKRTIRARKEMLNRLVLNLESYYKDTIKRIGERDEEFGMKILHWILFAIRPLTVIELRYAIAICPGDRDLDPDEDLPPLPLEESTLGLVTVDDWAETARFVHFTFKEHLLENVSLYFPTGHCLLAEATMAYLTFRCVDSEAGRRRYRRGGDLHPFWDYVIENWGHHVRLCEDEDVVESAHRLLESRVFSVIRLLNPRGFIYHDGRRIPAPLDFYASPLHAATYFRLSKIIKWLLTEDFRIEGDLNLEDENGCTPLSYAARRGYLDVVKLLIAHSGVDVNTKDHHGGTPLLSATTSGHSDVVEELLKRQDTDVNLADNYGQTPILLAISGRNLGVVKVLLERDDINVNLSDMLGNTPFFLAASSFNLDMMELLLERMDIIAECASPALMRLDDHQLIPRRESQVSWPRIDPLPGFHPDTSRTIRFTKPTVE